MKYGNFIEVERKNGQINLLLHGAKFANHIKSIFIENFNLPPLSEEMTKSGFLFTFSGDIDDHTFYRHLKTFSEAELSDLHAILENK